MKKILFILSNLLFGNLILALFVSSNFFLQSLMINFTTYFHLCFSVLIIISSFFFLRRSEKNTTRFDHFLYGFLTPLLPVILTTLLLIGVSFFPASIENQQAVDGILFIFRFSLIVSFTTGAIFWIPFGLLNTWYMRKNSFIKVSVDHAYETQ